SSVYLPSPTPPDPNAGNYAGALQTTLDRNDFAKLTAMMQAKVSPVQRREELKWARAQTEAGASVIVPALYANQLWRIGSNIDASAPEITYRDVAARFVLYSLVVAAVDGLRCKNQDAPKHLSDKVIRDNEDILNHAADRPPYSRGRLITAAME